MPKQNSADKSKRKERKKFIIERKRGNETFSYKPSETPVGAQKTNPYGGGGITAYTDLSKGLNSKLTPVEQEFYRAHKIKEISGVFSSLIKNNKGEFKDSQITTEALTKAMKEYTTLIEQGMGHELIEQLIKEHECSLSNILKFAISCVNKTYEKGQLLNRNNESMFFLLDVFDNLIEKQEKLFLKEDDIKDITDKLLADASDIRQSPEDPEKKYEYLEKLGGILDLLQECMLNKDVLDKYKTNKIKYITKGYITNLYNKIYSGKNALNDFGNLWFIIDNFRGIDKNTTTTFLEVISKESPGAELLYIHLIEEMAKNKAPAKPEIHHLLDFILSKHFEKDGGSLNNLLSTIKGRYQAPNLTESYDYILFATFTSLKEGFKLIKTSTYDSIIEDLCTRMISNKINQLDNSEESYSGSLESAAESKEDDTILHILKAAKESDDANKLNENTLNKIILYCSSKGYLSELTIIAKNPNFNGALEKIFNEQKERESLIASLPIFIEETLNLPQGELFDRQNELLTKILTAAKNLDHVIKQNIADELLISLQERSEDKITKNLIREINNLKGDDLEAPLSSDPDASFSNPSLSSFSSLPPPGTYIG